MSLSGSPPRRWLGLVTGRSHPASARSRRSRRVPSVRRTTRDFDRWETEFEGPATPAPAPTTITTVVGTQIVEVTVGDRPIEEVGRHLRRLRAVLDAMTPDVSFVRWEGVLRAYDDYLFAASRLLAVPTDLVLIGFGRHRNEERSRLERVLGEAGLSVR